MCCGDCAFQVPNSVETSVRLFTDDANLQLEVVIDLTEDD